MCRAGQVEDQRKAPTPTEWAQVGRWVPAGNPQSIWTPRGELTKNPEETATSAGPTVTVSDQHNLLRMNSSLLPPSKSYTMLLLASQEREFWETQVPLLGQVNKTQSNTDGDSRNSTME